MIASDQRDRVELPSSLNHRAEAYNIKTVGMIQSVGYNEALKNRSRNHNVCQQKEEMLKRPTLPEVAKVAFQSFTPCIRGFNQVWTAQGAYW